MMSEKEQIRIELNRLSDLAVSKWLQILFITCVLCVVALFLSFLQPIYVADKIATLWVILAVFQLGIIGGLVMSEVIREKTFKTHKIEVK